MNPQSFDQILKTIFTSRKNKEVVTTNSHPPARVTEARKPVQNRSPGNTGPFLIDRSQVGGEGGRPLCRESEPWLEVDVKSSCFGDLQERKQWKRDHRSLLWPFCLA